MRKLFNIVCRLFFWVISLSILLVSCVPEKKVAKEYLVSRKNISIILRAPQMVKMFNQISDSLDSIPVISEESRYYDKLKRARIINQLSESILMDNYKISLKRGLELMGYKTYLISDQESIMPTKDNALLISIGQIELDEKIHPIRDEINYKKHIYIADFDLGKIELNFWLELNRLENGVTSKPPRVLYTYFEKICDFKGDFRLDPETETMKYYSESQNITRTYVMGTMIKLGYKHAIDLNTFLMNEYIGYKLSKKKNMPLLGFDQETQTIYNIKMLPFTELVQEP